MAMLAGCGNSDPRSGSRAASEHPARADAVTVSYDMAETGVGWIELVASGADDATEREAFFRDVARASGRKPYLFKAALADRLEGFESADERAE
jgi:hypothetical protein